MEAETLAEILGEMVRDIATVVVEMVEMVDAEISAIVTNTEIVIHDHHQTFIMGTEPSFLSFQSHEAMNCRIINLFRI